MNEYQTKLQALRARRDQAIKLMKTDRPRAHQMLKDIKFEADLLSQEIKAVKAPAKAPAKPRSTWERFKDSYVDATGSSLVGAAVRKVADWTDMGKPEGASEAQHDAAIVHQERMSRIAARKRDEADKAGGKKTWGDTAVEFGAGMLGGADPTYLLAPARVLSKAPGIGGVAKRVANMAGVEAAADAGVQGIEIAEGVADEFDGRRVALAGATGGAFQGAFEGLSKMGRKYGETRTAARERARERAISDAADNPMPRADAASAVESIAREERRIHPRGNPEDRALEMTVTDDGGLPETPVDIETAAREDALREYAENSAIADYATENNLDHTRVGYDYLNDQNPELVANIREKAEARYAEMAAEAGHSYPPQMNRAEGMDDTLEFPADKGGTQEVNLMTTDGLRARLESPSVDNAPSKFNLREIMEAEQARTPTPETVPTADRKFGGNRVFPTAPVLNPPLREGGITSEPGFAYRTMSPAEYADAQANGAFLPKEKNPRYNGEKQWIDGGSESNFNPNGENVVVRVPLDRLDPDAPAKFEDAEVVLGGPPAAAGGDGGMIPPKPPEGPAGPDGEGPDGPSGPDEPAGPGNDGDLPSNPNDGTEPSVYTEPELDLAAKLEVEPGVAVAAGNINLSRLSGPVEIDTVLKETAENIKAAGLEPGVQTAKQTALLADELGMSPDKLFEFIPDLTPEFAVAARNMLAQSAADVVRLARMMARGDNGDNVKAALMEAWLKHGAIQERVTKLASIAGQLLQSFKITAKGGPGYQKALNNVPGPIDGTNLQTLAEMIAENADNPHALNRMARDSVKPKAEDYFFSAWYNMMLSGPQTHAVNIMGTASNFAVDLLETGVAALLGQGKRWSKNADRVMGRELYARIMGAVYGAKVGLSNMKKAFDYGTPLDMVGRMENPTVYNGRFSKYAETFTRALAAEDEFFRSMLHLSSLYGSAVRIAAKEGKTGEEIMQRAHELAIDPTDEMLAGAADYSRLIRFQDDPGVLGTAIERARQRHQGDGVGKRVVKGGLRVVVPYVRTPSSLLRTAIRRSPLGVLESRNIADFKAGGARRDQAIARVALGSSVVMPMAMWAMDGILTGNGPQDYRKKAELEASGWKPNSIKVGDEYISYAGMEPLSIVLNTVASLTEMGQEETDDSYFEKAMMMSVGFADLLSDSTWTENIAGLFAVMTSPVGMRKNAIGNYLANMASSMTTPAIIRQLNTTFLDTAVRKTTGDGSIEDRIVGRIKSGLPGYSEELPQTHDVYGRPNFREGALGPDALSRLRTSAVDNDPAAMELQRLAKGNPKPLVGPPGNSNIKVGGIPRRLTAEEFEEYQALSGQYILEYTRNLMATPEWKNMDDEERKGEIEGVVKDMRKAAREELFANRPPEPKGSKPKVEEGPSEEVEGEYLGQADEAQSSIRAIFPGIKVTDNVRKKGTKLAEANPDSWHVKTKDAVDVKPVKGMTFSTFLKTIRDNGYTIIEARDEVKYPSKHATGPHWHVVIRKN